MSSFYLQSDDLDEIDIEMFGGDPYQWQSNYFIKGNTATYDRGGYHDIANPLKDYHTYVIDWTKDAVTWSVDGSVIRTIPKDNAQGFHNHQWPFMLVFGLVVIHLINQVPLTGQVVSLITLKLHSLWVLSLFWLLIILQANNTVILINLVLGNPSKPMVVKLMEDTTKHKMISRNWKVDNLLTPMIVHPVHPPLLQIHQAHLPHHPVLHPAHLHLPLHHHHHHLPPPLQALLHPAKNPMQFQVLL